jgi:hypothetical protein
MINRTVLLIILSIQIINGLNLDNLCKSSFCNKDYSYKCTKNLCSSNKQTCVDYYKHKLNYVSRSSLNLFSFQSCESINFTIKVMNRNDLFCLKNSKCFKKQFILQTKNSFRTMRKNEKILSSTFKTFNKKIDCECVGKYSFKCGEYCTIDKKYCDLLYLRIKYQKKMSKNEIKTCSFFGQKLVIF